MLLLMLYCLTPGTLMYSVETVRRLTMGLMLGGQDFDRIEKNANWSCVQKRLEPAQET